MILHHGWRSSASRRVRLCLEEKGLAYENGRATMRNWIRQVDGLIGNLIVFNWVHGIAKTASQWSDAELVQMLDGMEATLRAGPWLAGGRYTLSDIAVVPFVKRIEEEIAPDEVSAARHPRVAAWWAAIQARPAFARARIGPFLE